MRRLKRACIAGALAGLLLWGGGQLFHHRVHHRGSTPRAAVARSAPARLPASGRAMAPQRAPPTPLARVEPTPLARVAPSPALPALPRSLRDTEVDGALRVGPDGDLVAAPELLALFDYFLTAGGEEPDDVIRARIVAEIRGRASLRVADQAISLLDDYLAYREDASSLEIRAGDDPAQGLEALRALRRERFGEAMATALFGDDERECAVAIEESHVFSDPTLLPEEREARIAALEATLPARLLVARAAATRPLRQQAEEQALRDAGATDAQMYEHRVAVSGAAAAARLAALDRERAAWRARVDAFRESRRRIAAAFVEPERRRAEEESLLARAFSPAERLRVRAILQMSAPSW